MIYSRKYSRNFVPLKQDNSKYTLDFRPAIGKCLIEIKDGKGKILVNTQGIKPNVDYRLEFMGFEKGNLKNVKLGNFSVDNYGKGEFRQEFDPDNICDTDSKIEDFNIIAIMCGDGKDVSSALVGYVGNEVSWKDKYASVVAAGVNNSRRATYPQMPNLSKPDISDKLKDYNNCPEVPETPTCPEVPEKPEVSPITRPRPTNPIIPEAPETPACPEVPETPEVSPITRPRPTNPIMPEMPETPVCPEVPETPEMPEIPNQNGSSEIGDFELGLIQKEEGLIQRQLGLIEKEKGLIEKERNVNGSKSSLDDFARALDEKEQGLLEKEQGLAQKEQGLIEKETAIRNGNLPNYSSELRQKELNLINREEELISKEEDLIQRERNLIRQNPTSDRERGLIEREKGLIERDLGLIEREKGLIEKERGILEIENGIRERNAGLSGNSQQTSTSNSHDNFKKMIDKLRKNISNIENLDKTSPDKLDIENMNIDYIKFKNAKMSPFKNGDINTNWYRISPYELTAFKGTTWKYANNPFVFSCYKRYNHLMLGVNRDKGVESYILAVPCQYEDNFELKEFNRFMPINPEITVNNISNGEYGYRILNI